LDLYIHTKLEKPGFILIAIPQNVWERLSPEKPHYSASRSEVSYSYSNHGENDCHEKFQSEFKVSVTELSSYQQTTICIPQRVPRKTLVTMLGLASMVQAAQ